MLPKNSGFSLIELIIAFAIISILLAISYPQYIEHLIKIHRSYAAVALTDLAARMEQYYLQNHTYVGATLANLGASDADYRDYYQLKIAGTAHEYTLRAEPQNQQAQKDVACGTLILDAAGNKTTTGTGDVTECF